MGDAGREMVSWTIKSRNNIAGRAVWLVIFGKPIEVRCAGIFRRQ